MKRANFRFYQELNDFLPQEKRKMRFTHLFTGKPAIKDEIEAIGVPHTEIDLILANGVSVDFHYHLQDNDEISVYPTFESFDITPIYQLRPKPLRHPKFILDVHLGRLSKYLRMLGLDTSYDHQFTDQQIIDLSQQEKRIILTRDKGLLKNKRVTHGYWLRMIQPKLQTKEVLQRFDLFTAIKPFSRCLTCNGKLIKIDKKTVLSTLPAKTQQFYQLFYQCQQCAKIYWQGSHYDRMQKLISDFINC